VSADELVEEVDLEGRALRVVTRAEMRTARLRHRAVFIVVLSSDGRLLVHRRADDKDLWPSRWDVAAGGVVGAGEAWDDAAARELAEELGVDAVRLEHLAGASFEDPDVRLVGETYLAVTDGPFRFADGEVVAARWVDRVALDDLLTTEQFCPDSLAIALPLVIDRIA
jgi:isopentenyldiphosphate isomerase